MECVTCNDIFEVLNKAEEGCGALVLAEETLKPPIVQQLSGLIQRQPSWSDLPICIVATPEPGKREISRTLQVFASNGNITLLERPFRAETLINTLRVALRSRVRQYLVRDLVQERTALAERFRLMAETIPQKIFTADAGGRITYLNTQWQEFAGLTSYGENENWSWIDLLHPQDKNYSSIRWKSALETGKPLQMEHRLRRHDQVYRWHLTHVQPLRNPDGTVSLWIGSNTDIEEQKQAEAHLEKLVSERTQSLSESNNDLEAFCYTIAHDLRAPLRAQQAFASLLIDSFGEALGENGRNYAERIHAAAKRLDELVTDLLAYSRISRADLPLVPVDLRKIVCEVERQMAFEIGESKAEVSIDAFDTKVLAHELTLKTALQNLLSNALKFTKPGTTPVIRIYVENCGESMICLWVQDSGIGIPPDYHRQIFGIFQRLHKTGEYPGTGVGLAIVQKSMDRMGGGVNVKSIPGDGSAFGLKLRLAE